MFTPITISIVGALIGALIVIVAGVASIIYISWDWDDNYKGFRNKLGKLK